MRPLVAAQGDSWFDFPGADVLSLLEARHGFDVVSCAHRGDTLEAMAYDSEQGTKLARMFRSIKAAGARPDAVLVSAGGNDVAGDELSVLLNPRGADLPIINLDVLRGVMERLEVSYRSLLFGITGLCRHWFGRERDVPIVLHGYGYPIPDGRGFLGGASILPGPWLRPSFVRKGHMRPDTGDPLAWLEELERCSEHMRGLIDAFALMLLRVQSTPGLEHVRSLDLRPALATVPGRHRGLWADELHPTPTGFELVAAMFAQAVEAYR
jgi:lysophospholipase L1-like esterase